MQFLDGAGMKCTTLRGAGPPTLFAIASRATPTNGEATITLLPSFQEGDRGCILRASGHDVHVTVLPRADTVSFCARPFNVSTPVFL